MLELLEVISAIEVCPVEIKEIQRRLMAYLGVCKNLTRTEPQLIERAQEALSRLVMNYAKIHSPIYNDKIIDTYGNLKDLSSQFHINKSDLEDKSLWYVPDSDSTENSTSGTTGPKFRYQIWNPFYTPIEKEHHYRLVLEEFDLKSPRVLHMVSGLSVPDSVTLRYGAAVIRMASSHRIKNYVQRLHCSHGGDSADYWHIDFSEKAYLNVKDYCGYVVEFLESNQIDVLLASGGLIELLTTFLISDENHAFPRLGKLISNTGDRVNSDTLAFLVETGVFDQSCDHMRCWDGGAGFFTCKHGTYHLNEELSYIYTKDGEMATIDFFNYASPFINYMNGDKIEIDSEWKCCDCGRWYRPFRMLNRRSRGIRNAQGDYYDSQKLYQYLRDTYQVQFASLQDNLITIEESLLSEDIKKQIVYDLAKDHIAVNYFTQSNLRAMDTTPKNNPNTDPDIGFGIA